MSRLAVAGAVFGGMHKQDTFILLSNRKRNCSLSISLSYYLMRLLISVCVSSLFADRLALQQAFSFVVAVVVVNDLLISLFFQYYTFKNGL